MWVVSVISIVKIYCTEVLIIGNLWLQDDRTLQGASIGINKFPPHISTFREKTIISLGARTYRLKNGREWFFSITRDTMRRESAKERGRFGVPVFLWHAEVAYLPRDRRQVRRTWYESRALQSHLQGRQTMSRKNVFLNSFTWFLSKTIFSLREGRRRVFDIFRWFYVILSEKIFHLERVVEHD